MPEPFVPRVRPTAMKHVLALAVLVLLAGCGSAESGSGSGSKDAQGTAPSPSSRVVTCVTESGRLLTTADVNGNGTNDQIRLERPSGNECPTELVANDSSSHMSAGVALDDGAPPVSGAFAVAVPGQDPQLVVTRAEHPRGGYQLRVYAAATHELVELKSAGQPLLPFVATDVQEHPWSIDCSADGLVLTEAVAHEPVGVAAAWDIQQTTYSLDGTTLTKGATKEIADNVLPQELEAKYPDLAKHAAFESCRAS